MNNKLLLTVDPIPEQNWGLNLAHLLPQKDWDIIRRNVYKQYSYKCGVCGATNGVLNCHEMWLFDDIKHIQRLIGLIALCTKCHDVKHLGRSLAMVAQKIYTPEYFLELINHFLAINGCNIETFYEHQGEIKSELKLRSQYKYSVDFGILAPKILSGKTRRANAQK